MATNCIIYYSVLSWIILSLKLAQMAVFKRDFVSENHGACQIGGSDKILIKFCHWSLLVAVIPKEHHFLFLP